MPDVTAIAIDDMEAIYGGLARRARAELGVTAWGMQVFTLPPTPAGSARRHSPAPGEREPALVKRFMAAWDAVDVEGLVALLTEDALMTMPPERIQVAGARAIGDFFGSAPHDGRLDEIRLVQTSANRQPALAAYSRGEDGRHRPYGLMVLRIEGDLIAGIVGFPDPWPFEQCGLPAELD